MKESQNTVKFVEAMSSNEENCSGEPEMIEIDSEDDTSIGLLMSVEDEDPEMAGSPQTESKSRVATPKCVWPKRIAPKCVMPKKNTSQLISNEFKVNEQKQKEQKKFSEQKQKEQKHKVMKQNQKEQKVMEEIFSSESMSGLTAGRGGGAYQCQLCIKSFTSTQQLTQHSLVHSNLRKHQCPYCDKTFKQLSHVQQHQRIHTGELPYQCSFENCERSFRQSSSLKQHMKGHARETGSTTTATDQSIPLVAKRRIKKKRTKKSHTEIKEQERQEYEEQPTNEVQQPLTDDDRFPDCLTSLPPSPVAEQCRLASEESLASSFNKNARKTLNDSVYDTSDDIESDDVKVEPIYRQSLVSLSSKLEEISKRERSLRLSADQMFSGQKPL